MVEKPNTQETDQGWIDDINRHIQALLATPELHGREVEARSRPDLSLEIVVDGEVFSDVESIADGAVRDLVKAAIERWQNETATALAFATLPLRRPLPFRSRGWMIGWLVVMILLFVLPPLFITSLFQDTPAFPVVSIMKPSMYSAIPGRHFISRPPALSSRVS